MVNCLFTNLFTWNCEWSMSNFIVVRCVVLFSFEYDIVLKITKITLHPRPLSFKESVFCLNI
ncbi:hypothetical protein BpHYR1_013737 [Brachionus plicatilis]|uniref:Uncharacterized protein n=1 Tax=Brachionus plicatilis TaxID=10195 RepID=A0A3M7PA94_BRAPC|nr:hypothetical protein BpHYR1_013737 [Brachionus plicatilis]